LNFLKQLPDDWFGEEVPLTTRKYAKGRGYSSSIIKRNCMILEHLYRPENTSFNWMHGYLMERVFYIAIDKQISDLGEIANLYQIGLAQARLNPKKPYMRSDLVDIMD
jgi:hypothetical protein